MKKAVKRKSSQLTNKSHKFKVIMDINLLVYVFHTLNLAPDIEYIFLNVPLHIFRSSFSLVVEGLEQLPRPVLAPLLVRRVRRRVDDLDHALLVDGRRRGGGHHQRPRRRR